MVLLLIPLMVIFSAGGQMGWMWTIGTKLHPKLPEAASMNLTKLKICLVFPLICFVGFVFFIVGMFRPIVHDVPIVQMNFSLAFVLFPLEMVASFCMLYTFYFIGKELKAVELQRPVGFSDFAGEFFLLWFYYIGIWILQPRINKLFDEHQQYTIE